MFPTTLYMETSILIRRLPQHLQSEIPSGDSAIKGKSLKTSCDLHISHVQQIHTFSTFDWLWSKIILTHNTARKLVVCFIPNIVISIAKKIWGHKVKSQGNKFLHSFCFSFLLKNLKHSLFKACYLLGFILNKFDVNFL